jgi:hypothetical protein
MAIVEMKNIPLLGEIKLAARNAIDGIEVERRKNHAWPLAH